MCSRQRRSLWKRDCLITSKISSTHVCWRSLEGENLAKGRFRKNTSPVLSKQNSLRSTSMLLPPDRKVRINSIPEDSMVGRAARLENNQNTGSD